MKEKESVWTRIKRFFSPRKIPDVQEVKEAKEEVSSKVQEFLEKSLAIDEEITKLNKQGINEKRPEFRKILASQVAQKQRDLKRYQNYVIRYQSLESFFDELAGAIESKTVVRGIKGKLGDWIKNPENIEELMNEILVEDRGLSQPIRAGMDAMANMNATLQSNPDYQPGEEENNILSQWENQSIEEMPVYNETSSKEGEEN